MTQQELEQKTEAAMRAIVTELADSPQSRNVQGYNTIGYYQGYCAAKGWQASVKLIVQWTDSLN